MAEEICTFLQDQTDGEYNCRQLTSSQQGIVQFFLVLILFLCSLLCI